MLCLAFNGVAVAQDMARLPYAMAHRYLELFDSLAHLDRISPSMMITSTDPGVKPDEIEFKLVDGGNWVSFKPDPAGVIVFDRNEAWLENTLTLISNQPRGTLQLEIAFNAHAFGSTVVKYSDLMLLSEQFGEALTALAAMRDQSVRPVQGLTFQLPAGAGLSIRTTPRPVELKPNAGGLLVLKIDPALGKENPDVVFSELPLGVVPLQ